MRMLRCLLVQGAATALALLALRLLLPGLTTPAVRFDEQLVRICTGALIGCLAWAWLSVSAVALAVLRSPAPERAAPGWVPAVVRRAVLGACGVAVLTAGPALAADIGVPTGPQPAAGLPYPARAMDNGLPAPARSPGPGPAPVPAEPVVHAASEHDVVVRAGDSLWTIAARHLPAGASDHEVGRAWQRLYQLNREVIGDDPGLIRPGQRLLLPDVLGR